MRTRRAQGHYMHAQLTCTEKAGNNYSASLYICRVAFLLLRQRRGAAGSGLGATVKYL
jgi:3-hydroxy-3-methylglutaryl CoA synthase